MKTLNPEERVHFLYMADDAGGAGGENPEIEFEDEDDIVISDEPLEDDTPQDPAPEVSKEDLLAKIESMQQQMQDAQRRGDEVSALREGIAELGKSMQTAPTQAELNQQQQPRQPQESEDEYRKKFNENFYDDPYSYMQDFTMKKLGPEFNRILSTQEKMFKREIQRDPQRKETYSKYQDEIEQEYQQIPQYQRMTDPDAYAKAHDRVVARHIDEIVQQRVQEAMQNAGAQNTQNTQNTQGREGAKEPIHAEAASNPRPQAEPKKRQKRLTNREARWADNRGLPYAKALEILERHPERRAKINGGS
jgi:hypothetical protein